MPMSFKDSKESMANSVLSETSLLDTSISQVIELDAENTYTQCRDGRYTWYEKYHDDKFSVVDSLKNVKLNDLQVNLTREENSQFIPFKMQRYWDGVDFMDMLIQIHYSNEFEEGELVNAVNVSYNDEYIRFAWLANKNVTVIHGTVKFQLWATGKNERDENFRWFTKPNKELNVLKSLSTNGVIEPDHNWLTSLVDFVSDNVNKAKEYAEIASNAVPHIEKAKEDAVATIGNTKTSAITAIQQVIESAPDDYIDMSNNIGEMQKVLRTKADAIVQTVTGSTVSVSDSSDDYLRGLDVYGKTTQLVTTGAQLFDASKIKPFSGSGIDIYNNGDGSFTVSGTATGYPSSFYVAKLQIGKYTVSGSSAVPFPHRGLFRARISRGNSVFEDYMIGQSFTVDGSEISIDFRIQVDNNITLSTFVFFPMVNVGTSAIPWEPYTGGLPSPNPEYPQRLKAVNAVEKSDRNLLPLYFSESETTTFSGINITYSQNGDISFSGTALSVVSIYLHDGKFKSIAYGSSTQIELDGTYFLSGKIQGGTLRIRNINGITVPPEDTLSADGTKTLKGTYVFNLFVDVGSTVSGIVRPMLNVGTYAKSWKPYQESDVNDEVLGNIRAQIYSKNLCDLSTAVYQDRTKPLKINNGFVLKPTSDTDRIVLINCNLKAGQTYFLSYKTKHLGTVSPKPGSFFPTNPEQYFSNVVTVKKDEKVFGIYFDKKLLGQNINAEITDIQIELGNVVSEYEPYRNQQELIIPTPNGLNGIPVVSAGNHTDSNGQQWVCDTIEYHDGIAKHIQRVVKYTFDGSEDESWEFETNTVIGNRYRFYLLSKTLHSDVSGGVYSMNSNFQILTNGGTWSKKNGYTINTHLSFPASTMFYVSLNGTESLAEFKQYLANKPMTLLAVLKTPIETDIQNETFLSLHSNYPSTVITNDFDADMEVKYNADTKNYIVTEHNKMQTAFDVKIAEILSLLPPKTQAMMIETDTNNMLTESETKQ